ncbi:centromere protein U isoform X3 [Cricetulus griseus]|uniref:centromere protein U isoform X3 n=1 Tax=Cricetulus griseus TaxID=10029 RepID=UPI000F741AAF|nr:centromere protein U isoform X3 [Cricetulus griseus]
MAARRRLRYPGFPGAKHSKNTLGRTHSRKHKAGQKHNPKDVFDFADNSDVSSMLGEMEEEEEPYESFDPPLHSTAIDAEEELSKHCGSSASPATHGRQEGRSLSPSESESSENKSIKISAKKPRRRLESISDEFESSEDNVRRKVGSTERASARQHQTAPAASPAPHVKPVKCVTPERTRCHSTQPSVVEETGAVKRQLKTQKKVRLSPGRKKKSGSEATDSDASERMHIWCLEGKRRSSIMELDVILSVFEKTFLEYKLEPQLKQLQTKYDHLTERKSSLKNSTNFLSNLKQLYQDYSEVQEKEPKEKEKYDSSSLPALLFEARTVLGAKKHLKTINYQLGKLLEQE